MRSFFRWALLLGALILAAPLAGCGNKQRSAAITPTEQQSFNSSPDLQQMWNAVQEAGRTNDYVGAQTLLFNLMSQNLTPEQRAVATKEGNVISERMYAAAQQGDAAASNAIVELRHNPPNRRVH